jgi:preprotein translocase subunit SecG
LRQAYWIEAQGAIIGSRAVTLKFSNIGILQLLERLTIALFVVFLVAALVLVIKYDIERTAAARMGMNSAPIRGAQPRSVSG